MAVQCDKCHGKMHGCSVKARGGRDGSGIGMIRQASQRVMLGQTLKDMLSMRRTFQTDKVEKYKGLEACSKKLLSENHWNEGFSWGDGQPGS